MKVLKKVLNWLFATDKLLHMLVCFSIMLTGNLVGGDLVNTLIVTTVVAVAKEYFDLLIRRSNTWKHSLEDILADAIGAGLAILLIVLF